MSNIVAIVGRPNVGKSTLFNRLTESRKAIVDEMSGVTRDRQYGKGIWNGIDFSIIDTGGYAVNSEDAFEEEIRKQVILAIEEADVILFVVDDSVGITAKEQYIFEYIQQSNKKSQTLFVVNKLDKKRKESETEVALSEYYSLGFSDII